MAKLPVTVPLRGPAPEVAPVFITCLEPTVLGVKKYNLAWQRYLCGAGSAL